MGKSTSTWLAPRDIGGSKPEAEARVDPGSVGYRVNPSSALVLEGMLTLDLQGHEVMRSLGGSRCVYIYIYI